MPARDRKQFVRKLSSELAENPAVAALLTEQAQAAHARQALPLLSLVVPFYNEQETIGLFFEQVIPALEAIDGIRFEIVCVNDGSRDATLPALVRQTQIDGRVRVIDLTRNFGKEAALSAGLDESRGDVIVPFDADLQDPPQLITQLVEKWREGYDVVLAKRADRSSDSALKRHAAAMFYRLHNALSEVKIPENVGDFRLITRDVANALQSLPESRRFRKGLFAWVGYPTAVVEYVRDERAAGKTKFSGWKLWNLALESITSFGTLPLRIWTYVGATVALLALCWAGYLIVRTLVFGVDVPGYASLVSFILILGGIQLIGIGVLGEYVGRIYFESKNRPIYLVRHRHEKKAGDD